MAKITAYDELDAVPAADDQFILVDVSDTTQAATGTLKRIDADRLARTDGSSVTTTGAGVLAFTNTPTVSFTETMTAANNADVVREFHYPFYWPGGIAGAETTTAMIPITDSTSYTSSIGESGAVQYNMIFNVSNMPTNATVKFRAQITVSATSTGSLQLLRSGGSAVSGSEITTTTPDSFGWVTSGDIKSALTAGAQTYIIQAKNSAGSGVYTQIGGAYLLVEVP